METKSEAISLPRAEELFGPLPQRLLTPAHHGAVVSKLVFEDDRLRDLALVLGPELRFFERPLPMSSARALNTYLKLAVRNREQLAHEIGSPATGILGILEMILEYEQVNDSVSGLLKEANRAAEHLTALLVDPTGALLSLGVRQRGPLKDLVRKSLKVSRLHGELADCLVAAGVVCTREVELPDGLLDGMLTIFLSNAYRTRRSDARPFQLIVEAREGWIQVGVEDVGYGMNQDVLWRAGELGFSTRTRGAGLGLFLARYGLAELGGLVSLRSQFDATDGGRVSAETHLPVISAENPFPEPGTQVCFWLPDAGSEKSCVEMGCI